MSCERCGRSPAYTSHRLGQRVCWRCDHGSFTAEETAEAKRVERQRALAQAIRDAAEQAEGSRRQKLRDRALLIETAESTDEVLVLVDEVQDLGVRLEARR